MLVFALSPAAHADQPTYHSSPCVGNDGSTLGANATIKFVEGTDSGGHSIHVLSSVKSVMNGCNVEYAQLSFQTKDTGTLTSVWIAPGANRALGATVLQRLGIDQLQFDSWGITVRPRVRSGACPPPGGGPGSVTAGFVESNNHVTVCPR
jgi:hypothetical protein